MEYIISDMYEPYLLVQKSMFSKAKYVVDLFHYARYIMDALDKVGIRLQETFGYNSKEYRLLKNKKNISTLNALNTVHLPFNSIRMPCFINCIIFISMTSNIYFISFISIFEFFSCICLR